MDSQNFTVNAQQISEWKYIFDQSTFWQFSSDLSDGTLTGFDVTDFFTSKSDYVVHFMYYPIRLDKFATLTTLTSMKIGKKTASYPCSSIPRMPSHITLFSTTVSRHFNNFLDYSRLGPNCLLYGTQSSEKP